MTRHEMRRAGSETEPKQTRKIKENLNANEFQHEADQEKGRA
jgi:hypothetical protein